MAALTTSDGEPTEAERGRAVQLTTQTAFDGKVGESCWCARLRSFVRRAAAAVKSLRRQAPIRQAAAAGAPRPTWAGRGACFRARTGPRPRPASAAGAAPRGRPRPPSLRDGGRTSCQRIQYCSSRRARAAGARPTSARTAPPYSSLVRIPHRAGRRRLHDCARRTERDRGVHSPSPSSLLPP
jgi:hypothetical protein